VTYVTIGVGLEYFGNPGPQPQGAICCLLFQKKLGENPHISSTRLGFQRFGWQVITQKTQNK